MKSDNINLWLGSQVSYDKTLEAELKAFDKHGDSQTPHLPNLLTIQGNVGVIDVSGSLVNGNAGFMSFFGVTGYGDIRDALLAAVQSPDVSAILMNFDTGGGSVAGVHETAQLIARVNKIKPVVGYTGSTAASAGLWLMSSAGTTYVAQTAITGSLGIIMVHKEISKYLANEGIKTTIIRAGAEKALVSPYEPLTPEAKAGLQLQAQTMYDIFLGHVAEMRGVSNTVADAKFGQGREFIGQQAVDAGLMDKVGTLEDAFTKAATMGAKIASKTSKPIGSKMIGVHANISNVTRVAASLSATLGDNSAILEGTLMSKPLTQEQLIATAAGVDLSASTEKTPEQLAAEAKLAEDALNLEAAKPAAPSELTSYLKAQVEELTVQAATLKVANATLEASALANKASTEALADIGRNSIRTMTIALGGKAENVATLATADVVAEHTRVSAVFQDKFKVGRVAATDTSESQKPAKATVNPLFVYAAKSL